MKKKEQTGLTEKEQKFLHNFYEQNKGFMFYVARQFASTQPECEDLVQGAMERFIKNISSIQTISCCKIRKYIVYTIRSVFLDAKRKEHGNSPLSLDEEATAKQIDNYLRMDPNIAELEAKLVLLQLKKKLSPRDWKLLVGKYFFDYSQEELAESIGVAPDSVRTLLSRARKAAKAFLTGTQNHGGGNDV